MARPSVLLYITVLFERRKTHPHAVSLQNSPMRVKLLQVFHIKVLQKRIFLLRILFFTSVLLDFTPCLCYTFYNINYKLDM